MGYAFIAYGQLILGLPLLVAFLAWFLPNYLVEKLCEGREISTLYYIVVSVLHGLISLMFTYYVFEFLHVAITIFIPVILLAVHALWKFSRDEGFMIPFLSAGIAAGYKLFPLVRPLMAQW